MQGKGWFLVILFLLAIAFMTNGTLAGVEPSPFSDFLPIIKNFRTEIAKANEKLERFDLSKRVDLYTVTWGCKSIPTMQGLVEEMSGKTVIIGDMGIRTKMEVHIRSLYNILKIQEDNRRDKASAQKALNEMADILDQMQALIK